MRVYLVQHGRAKSEEEDPQRRLTDKGIGEVEKVADFLRPCVSWQKERIHFRTFSRHFIPGYYQIAFSDHGQVLFSQSREGDAKSVQRDDHGVRFAELFDSGRGRSVSAQHPDGLHSYPLCGSNIVI